MKTTNQTRANQFSLRILIPLFFLFAGFVNSYGYNITDLKATYSSGQTFLTWIDPSTSNLQYNVYRSTTKFTDASKVTASKYLGFVRDNSSENIPISQQEGKKAYFKIKDNSPPLKPEEGLYVVTCTGNQSYYYAVTVTNLSTGSESKTIIMGENSLTTAISENVTMPQPVFQNNVEISGGDVKQRYVQFGNNQETPLFPALTSTGSYGFNLYITQRGNSSNNPLVVVYEGEGVIAKGSVGLDASFTNCFILGLDDWLPIPTGNGIGDNAHFCCYHENFNIYSDKNPIPNSGIVKTYPQRRYIEAIHWAITRFPIDANRVYTKGISTTGLAALLTSAIIPEEIPAVYEVVEHIPLSTHNKAALEQL